MERYCQCEREGRPALKPSRVTNKSGSPQLGETTMSTRPTGTVTLMPKNA
jgi:hypothetical protein